MKAENDFSGVEREQLPGNTRPFFHLIRFGADLENFVCSNNTFIRGLEKVLLQNGNEVLWVCGTFASFPKVSFHVVFFSSQEISNKER